MLCSCLLRRPERCLLWVARAGHTLPRVTPRHTSPALAQVPSAAQDALRVLTTIHKELFTADCVVGSGGKSVG